MNKPLLLVVSLLVLAAVFFVPHHLVSGNEKAQKIYFNGTIITVDSSNPTAEALAVGGKEILAVGTKEDVFKKTRDEDTVLVDLEGKTMLPGFIDSHGHVVHAGLAISNCNLAPPPAGPVSNIPGLQNALAAYVATRDLQEGDWIIGEGYDDSLMAEVRHPDRYELDAVTTEFPIMAKHVSGHVVTCNSKALELAGITADTPNPPGGIIRRVPGSQEPNGVLEETALYMVYAKLPPVSPADKLQNVKDMLQVYASYGITTAQECYPTADSFQLMEEAIKEGPLLIDVIEYPVWVTMDSLLGPEHKFGKYRNGLKIQGVKLVLDGSPQAKTAYLSEPYHIPPEGQPADYRGYPAMPDEQVDYWIKLYMDRNIQIIAHTNGDAASEQLINAVEKATTEPGDRRTVMIHAQTVREDQLDRMKNLDIMPSFFVAHTYYWGDWHRDSVFGVERAYRISPAQSALQRDMHFTFHNDSPVVPANMLYLMWTGVNRVSRSGDIIGPAQRVDVMSAIRAVTIEGAYQVFEEDRKGSLVAGKRADLVILDQNPLTVAPMAIKDINVIETIKNGKTIYRAE